MSLGKFESGRALASLFLQRKRERSVLRLLAICCLLVTAGCQEDRGLIPVYGTVTLSGESMPGPGDMTFVPVDPVEGYPLRPAKAEFGANGKYQAQSFQPGDGLYPGTYKVLVYCWEVPPTPDGPPAKSYIDTKYQNQQTSGLEVQVKPDAGKVVFNVEL